MNAPYARIKFQWFTSEPPLSSFKKLLASTPSFMMSKDHECKKAALHECPPIPYVPKKDYVLETVSAFKDDHLKTQIGKGMKL
jgi:hypothetical protein